jgi:hypothetical protein
MNRTVARRGPPTLLGIGDAAPDCGAAGCQAPGFTDTGLYAIFMRARDDTARIFIPP